MRAAVALLALAAAALVALVAAASLAAAPAAAAGAGLSRAELRDELAGALAGDGSAGGAWVYDTDAQGSDAVLFSDSASRARIPASNEKLFTTAAFLAQLGPEARLETRVYDRGKLTGASHSVLSGDLVIVGDGDPAFGTTRFARAHDQPVTPVSELAREIADAGIKRIRGRILADDTIFDRKRHAGPYLSPLSGLSFNDGYAGDGYAGAPELVAAKGLKAALRKRGVAIGGKVGHAHLTDRALKPKPLASVSSTTVAELIEETNVPSNNFFAEMLLKRLAAANGKRGTRRRGADRVEAFANSLGTDLNAVDGSGLSRRNRVSPEAVGKLLVAMAADDQNGPAFRSSLPVAGREGTVADRMRGTAAEGNCATKTGSLSDVSALSGYCQAGGHTIAFSLLMNEANLSAARIAQDRIAAAIARYEP
jgi:serine-type D-Ala-D-Ala carboxypeptidase/endopeptidase (penicillin-binding protein 4)